MKQKVNEEMKKEARRIVRIRQNGKENSRKKRKLSKDYDFKGALGEVGFAKLFNMEVDDSKRLDGDDGYEFKENGYKIDIKTFSKPYNLIVEEGTVLADIYVLCGVSKNYNFLTWYGWEDKENVLDAPKKDFGYGIINHYIHRSKLRDFEKIYMEVII